MRSAKLLGPAYVPWFKTSSVVCGLQLCSELCMNTDTQRILFGGLTGDVNISTFNRNRY